MNELATMKSQLPDTVDQLVDYVVINEEKLNAVNAAIRAARKAGDINLKELQKQQRELEITTVAAQCRLGELTGEMEKAKAGRHGKNMSEARTNKNTKEQTLTDSGLTRQRASEYERMAAHPDVVERIIQEGEHVTKSAVLNAIKENKQPHVSNNSHDNEWYTPEIYIEAAREVMGGVIDLDPASNDFANQTIKAKKYYSIEDDGLQHEWFGNIWMNPPYSTKEISDFARKLSESTFNQAVVLVNNATETEWFRTFIQKANAIVFPTGRIKYRKRDGEKGTPLQGQAFIYFGQNENTFLKVFSRFGWGCKIAKL